MSEGLLDTSVVVDRNDAALVAKLPDEPAISAITLAELTLGPLRAATVGERAVRQDRLQRVEAEFEPIPFDAEAARSYGHIAAAVAEIGRSHRRRMADLLIAATAHANRLPLYTRNPDDFAGLGKLISIVPV